MHGEVLTVDKACQRQLIEDFHELLVGLLVVVQEHLVTEVEGLRHVARLVIPTQQHNVVRVSQLETE